MKILRECFLYFLALWRPSLRLEKSPERLLMPLILSVSTVFVAFASVLPLKIVTGAAYEARGIDGHLVVHVARDNMGQNEFQNQLSALVSRLQENENIARVTVATGPDLNQSLETLFGTVATQDDLYGGIVRLDLLERSGWDANIENLQFEISNFTSAYIDDFRVWKEASQARTRQVLQLGAFVLLLTIVLIAATLNLTIRLALRMHQKTLEVLHHLGANDSFGAMLFQAITFQRAVIGALFGMLVSVGLLWLLGAVLRAKGYQGAAQIDFGQISALVLSPITLIAISVLVARHTALRIIRQAY